ncbi:MAG: DNA primase [Chitinophagales bacterium]|nr:DNA primase [Chitinophagales bacterium]MDW8428163.1 DNA primase [Chitinophagales bacterium]
MISPRTKEQILSAVRIEEVIGQFVSLKRRGKNLVGLCPFHAERTPSFHVLPERGIYKCFGCNKGGDVISFLIEHERMSFLEAVRWLADRYHIALEFLEKDKAQTDRQEQESLYIVMEFARRHFHQNLLHTSEGMTLGYAYFRERGITDDIIRRFQLGYACRGGNDLAQAARAGHYSLDRLRLLGLVNENSGTDFFQERVIFPIHNLAGKPVAFAGRIMKNNQHPAKYINSPESSLYRKSEVLYGLYEGRDAIRKSNECFITEGYMDVLALHLAGVENVVASSGTALTQEQVKLLKRFTQNVTIVFDGDEAGIKAALRGAEVLLGLELNIRAVLLPEGHDPHSFLMEHGAAALRRVLQEQRQDLIAFVSGILLPQAGNDPLKRAEAIRQVVHLLSCIPDAIKRTVLVKECSKRFQLNEEVLHVEINALIQRQFAQKAGLPADPPVSKPQEYLQDSSGVNLRLHAIEKDLLRLLLLYGDRQVDDGGTVAAHVANLFKEISLSHPLYKKIYEEYMNLLKEGSQPPYTHFLTHPEEEIRNFITDIVASRWDVSANWLTRHRIDIPDPEKNYQKELSSLLHHYEMSLLHSYEQKIIEDYQRAAHEESKQECLHMLQQIQERKKQLARQRGTVVVS